MVEGGKKHNKKLVNWVKLKSKTVKINFLESHKALFRALYFLGQTLDQI